MQDIAPPESCIECNSRDIKMSETHVDGVQLYTLYTCGECAMQFWWPMKNPGADWYRHDERYSSRNDAPNKKPVDTHRRFLREKPNPGGRLLDVGCGTGNFLARAQMEGYQVTGVDFDPDAVQVAKDLFHLSAVSTESLKELIEKKETFDAITFFEVLEHVDNPGEFIEQVRSLLSPQGVIALSVPYRHMPRLFQTYDKPPRHLTRWEEVSIANFLERHGFKIKTIWFIRPSIGRIITKFHFLSAGVFSFGLVDKARAVHKGEKGKIPSSTPAHISLLKIGARAKDYIIFTIPAVMMYAYLIAIGRPYAGMYVLAEKIK